MLAACGLLLGLLAASSPATTTLTPALHSHFGHYTFALTWQPGFCSTESGCLPDQPKTVLIGLHGLWASRPQSLIARGVSAPQWWSRGCDYFHPSHRGPWLPAATYRQLQQVMPHLRHSLLRHEYDKHVQCFGFNTPRFFDTELGMRQAVVRSAFGRYLTQTARGHEVERTAVIDAFVSAFGTDQRSALQLQCGRSHDGRQVLTQMWITVRTAALARFPQASSLMDAPIWQDNCPSRFWVPDWSAH